MKRFFIEKKYIWVPSLIAIYAAIIACCNLDALDTESGRRDFWITVAVEIIILILTSIFLKKRADIRKKRDGLSSPDKDR